jgi:hypothetical protein
MKDIKIKDEIFARELEHLKTNTNSKSMESLIKVMYLVYMKSS